MTITDRQRNELYQAFERTIGEGPADTMMAPLPPVGWADVATKHDLAQLREQMATKADLQSLRAEVERSIREQTRTMLFGLAGINATFLAALLTGARLFGA